MKVIPKFTDLIAKAVDFEELEVHSKYQEEEHCYLFKNGYRVKVLRWNKEMIKPYSNTVEVVYWYDSETPQLKENKIVHSEQELREYIEQVRDLK